MPDSNKPDSYSSADAPVDLPNYDEVADTFLSLGAVHEPAEFHGYLCAYIALGHPLSNEAVLTSFVDFLDCEPPKHEREELILLLNIISHQDLVSDDLSFGLLLPDDMYPFEQRVEALGQWCQGFLHGFAAAGRLRQTAGSPDFSKEASELVTNLVAVSQIGLEANEHHNEHDFFEVVEFVRVAVMTLFAECNKVADEKFEQEIDIPDDVTLH